MKYCRGFVTNSSSGSYTASFHFELENIEVSRARALFSKYISESVGDDDCSYQDSKVEERMNHDWGILEEVYVSEYNNSYDESELVSVDLITMNKSYSDSFRETTYTYSNILEEYRTYLINKKINKFKNPSQKDIEEAKYNYYTVDFINKDIVFDKKFIKWMKDTYDLEISLKNIYGNESEEFIGFGESMDSVESDFYDLFESGLHSVIFNDGELDMECVEGTCKYKFYEKGKIVKNTIREWEISLSNLLNRIINSMGIELNELRNDDKILNTLKEIKVPDNIIEFLINENNIIVLFAAGEDCYCNERYSNIIIKDIGGDNTSKLIEFENTKEFIAYMKKIMKNKK